MKPGAVLEVSCKEWACRISATQEVGDLVISQSVRALPFINIDSFVSQKLLFKSVPYDSVILTIVLMAPL